MQTQGRCYQACKEQPIKTQCYQLHLDAPVLQNVCSKHKATLYRKHIQELSMKKTELVEAIANELDMQKSQATSALNTILETMTDALVRGESIRLRGFGSFDIRQYGPHEGMNPATSEKVKVKAKKLPRFKVGKDLRMKVNKEQPGG
jgi:nucleoid DNA-binding protein